MSRVLHFSWCFGLILSACSPATRQNPAPRVSSPDGRLEIAAEPSPTKAEIWSYAWADLGWIWLDVGGMKTGKLRHLQSSLAQEFAQSMGNKKDDCLLDYMTQAKEALFLYESEVFILRLPVAQRELAECASHHADSSSFEVSPRRFAGRPAVPPKTESGAWAVRDDTFLLVGPAAQIEDALTRKLKFSPPSISSRSRALVRLKHKDQVEFVFMLEELENQASLHLKYTDLNEEEAKKTEAGFKRRGAQFLELLDQLTEEDRQKLAEAMDISVSEFSRRDIVGSLGSALAEMQVTRAGTEVDVHLEADFTLFDLGLIKRLVLWSKMLGYNSRG